VDTDAAMTAARLAPELPKGVVLEHRSFFAVRNALATAGLDWIDWRDGDRSLIGMAGFHIGGIWWTTQGFAAGVTNVVMREFTTAGAVELIRTLGVTTRVHGAGATRAARSSAASCANASGRATSAGVS